eukprot:TRINITY_DN5350_c0_g1_i1.p1 TRINITY_DN5350_c0_g1~~TRINITY_DN5350_c0_g1_i1.p1  ORF type:complete len:167 (+),score=31.68 TRINITY_DN5350_c0_g1_i1:44-544(+)
MGKHDLFAQFSPRTFGSNYVSYSLLALLLVSACQYLYMFAFDVSITQYGFILVPVSLVTAFLLVLAYGNMTEAQYNRLIADRRNSDDLPSVKDLGLKNEEELSFLQQNNTRSESVAFSMFFNNLVFALLFFFCAFYMLRDVVLVYNYAISMISASVLTWQLASRTK